MDTMPPTPIDRVHERIDQLANQWHEGHGETLQQLGEIKAALAACGPCREEVRKHGSALFGNGTEGLMVRMKAAESKTCRATGDTISIKSFKTILAAVGALVGAIAAAIGAAVAAMAK